MDLYIKALSFSVHLFSFVELVYSFSNTNDYFFVLVLCVSGTFS